MIAYLEGTVLFKEEDYCVLQTSSGVGYQVFVPQSLLIQLVEKETIQLHVHTHVREGEITLYGFTTQAEIKLFEMLIKTSGVGPKLGIVTLSTLTPAQLVQAIHDQNVNQLNAVPGIGKKTASKLCLDMADQLKKRPIVDLKITPNPGNSGPKNTSEVSDLLSALTNMGFSEKDVLSVLGQVNSESSFEDRLKKALMLLTSPH